jgi:4-hydroxy-4-methyl-2-oxoglutarate aldolase
MSMKPVVVRKIPRIEAAVAAKLGKLGTATVHEAIGRRGLMKPYMRPIWPGAAIAGPAVTVLAQPGDNWMIHVAVEQCRKGDLMVVACSADNTDGMFGDVLATTFMARGIVGLVIDAGCRDIRNLTEMKYPVWSKAISAKGTIKATLGSVNIPVVCGGVAVNPGDVVVADDDGVVVVPNAEAKAAVAAGEQREAMETEKKKKLAAGELTLDLDKMREPLQKLGLTYVDDLSELK